MTKFLDLLWSSPDGLKLYARDYPPTANIQRAPIVCLHGLTRTSRDFESLAPWLAARGHRVLVPEMRGRGRSAYDPSPGNYLPATYAKDVLALFDATNVGEAILIGTSMGGIITTIVAALAPERVAGAILNDVGPEVDPRGIERISSYVGLSEPVTNWTEAAAYVRRINADAFPNFDQEEWLAFARRTFRDDNGQPRFDYDPAIREPIASDADTPPDPAAAWRAFESLADARPVLVLRGARSDILSPETAERMQQCASNVDLITIDHVGHAPTLDEPQCRAAIEDWLNRQV